MSAPTRSEILVLDALAQELRALVPDLAQQAARAVIDRRDNTGSGVFTQFKLDRRQPARPDGATGLFGTVHGDWPGFSHPVAFQAVLSGGQLQGLQATTYDESTLGLNVEAAPVANLFRIDASGRSVAVSPRQPARTDPPKARRNTPQAAVQTSVPTQAPPMGTPVVIVPRTFRENGAVASSVPATPRIRPANEPAHLYPAPPEPQRPPYSQRADVVREAAPPMNKNGVYALTAVVIAAALLVALFFGPFGLVVLGFLLFRAWSHKPTREAIQKALTASTAQSG